MRTLPSERVLRQEGGRAGLFIAHLRNQLKTERTAQAMSEREEKKSREELDRRFDRMKRDLRVLKVLSTLSILVLSARYF